MIKLNKYIKRPKLAIDFGTANCVIIYQGLGLVLSEPTVVAVSLAEKKVLAVGEEAKVMLGKVPEGIIAKRPVKNGGIANFRLAEALLRKFFERVLGKIRLVKPEVIVSVPAGINSVEERAIIQALHSVGAGQIFLLPEPIAAAVGAGMPIHQSSGNLIVNLGGGTAEIAVLSLNGLVSFESHRESGDALNSSIINYLRRKYSIQIGEQTAEQLKISVGSCLPMKDPLEIEVKGKNIKTNQPDSVKITSNDLVDPLRGVLAQIVESIRKVLAKTPPELISDIVDRGMVLSGGTSLLRGIDEYLTKSIGIPAHVVEDPLTCVAKGLSVALNNTDDFKRSMR
jgi:rod shape-determining protein MreB and related proteins